jgi:hypothetical protein
MILSVLLSSKGTKTKSKALLGVMMASTWQHAVETRLYGFGKQAMMMNMCVVVFSVVIPKMLSS